MSPCLVWGPAPTGRTRDSTPLHDLIFRAIFDRRLDPILSIRYPGTLRVFLRMHLNYGQAFSRTLVQAINS
jgi:hypothetical protein